MRVTVLLDVNRQPTVSGLLFISAIFDISSRRHAVSQLALPGDYGFDRMCADLLRWANCQTGIAVVLLLINQACSVIFRNYRCSATNQTCILLPPIFTESLA